MLCSISGGARNGESWGRRVCRLLGGGSFSDPGLRSRFSGDSGGCRLPMPSGAACAAPHAAPDHLARTRMQQQQRVLAAAAPDQVRSSLPFPSTMRPCSSMVMMRSA